MEAMAGIEPTVNFYEAYQSDVTAQQVKHSVKASIPMITAAVQKKVSSVGDYRREIHC